MEETNKQARLIRDALLVAFGYPDWRNPLSPLDELISTILSQNTNDNNRDRAFEALRCRFSTWEAVRDADIQQVIDAIRPAGLANQKGPRIQQLLYDITEQRGKLDLSFLESLEVEEARKWLLQFKGVGPKTAAIVLLFTLNKPAFPVDTHIYRVTGRLGIRPQKLSADQAHPFLEAFFSPDSYFDLHLNLIRLGREICSARRPNCIVCPLNLLCNYYQTSDWRSGQAMDDEAVL